MLAELFGAFWIFTAGYIAGLLTLPLLVNALLKVLKGWMKR